MTAHLVVFARNPVPGAVKTRLQARYTPQEAADIYRTLVLDTLENARGASADRHILAYTPKDAEEEFSRLAGPGWDLYPQAEADLGGLALEAYNRFAADEHTCSIPSVLLVDKRQTSIIQGARRGENRKLLPLPLKVRELRAALIHLLTGVQRRQLGSY